MSESFPMVGSDLKALGPKHNARLKFELGQQPNAGFAAQESATQAIAALKMDHLQFNPVGEPQQRATSVLGLPQMETVNSGVSSAGVGLLWSHQKAFVEHNPTQTLR